MTGKKFLYVFNTGAVFLCVLRVKLGALHMQNTEPLKYTLSLEHSSF